MCKGAEAQVLTLAAVAMLGYFRSAALMLSVMMADLIWSMG
jgi:hypothetical protein